jgi:cell division protein FtsW
MTTDVLPRRTAAAQAADKAPYDVVLLAAILGLVALGVVMVYSSSAVFAGARGTDGAYFLKRQAAAALAGLVAMAAVMRLGYRRLEKLAYPLLAICLVLIVLTFIPGIGLKAGGAQRWLKLAGFQLQPSEFAKVALCIYLAKSVAEKAETIKDFKLGFLPHVLVVGAFAALVLAQPDFGTMIVMLSVMLLVLFVAGAKMRYVAFAGLALVPLAAVLVVSQPYRVRRITGFLRPFEDRYGAGYQVAEALMSVGSGGLFGLGLGEGRQKLGFLPAGHTDYILASIGEELGLAGIALVLGLFTVIIWRGLRAAREAPDPFGAYLAFGITALLAVEVAINAGMCLGLLPSKGLALPFLSYGGTSLVKAMLAGGILLSISGGGGGFLAPPSGATRCT